MPRTDYYEVLGVTRRASQEEIKRAFRQLAREHHPDVNRDPAAADRFKLINEAYQILGDPDRRARYDRGDLVAAARPDGRGPFGAGPFEDLFDMFFGQTMGAGMRGGEPGPERGSDLRVGLEITLEDAAHGAERTITIVREETCSGCFGTGAEKGSTPEACPTCRGAGQVRYGRQTPFGSFQQIPPARSAAAQARSRSIPAATAAGGAASRPSATSPSRSRSGSTTARGCGCRVKAKPACAAAGAATYMWIFVSRSIL